MHIIAYSYHILISVWDFLWLNKPKWCCINLARPQNSSLEDIQKNILGKINWPKSALQPRGLFLASTLFKNRFCWTSWINVTMLPGHLQCFSSLIIRIWRPVMDHRVICLPRGRRNCHTWAFKLAKASRTAMVCESDGSSDFWHFPRNSSFLLIKIIVRAARKKVSMKANKCKQHSIEYLYDIVCKQFTTNSTLRSLLESQSEALQHLLYSLLKLCLKQVPVKPTK